MAGSFQVEPIPRRIETTGLRTDSAKGTAPSTSRSETSFFPKLSRSSPGTCRRSQSRRAGYARSPLAPARSVVRQSGR